jgi:hypothetical protein
VTEGFSASQAVCVEINGEQVEGVFVRPGDESEGVSGTSPAADRPYKRDVGWVRRSDTGELEKFPYARIHPRPES